MTRIGLVSSRFRLKLEFDGLNGVIESSDSEILVVR